MSGGRFEAFRIGCGSRDLIQIYALALLCGGLREATSWASLHVTTAGGQWPGTSCPLAGSDERGAVCNSAKEMHVKR